MNILTAVFFRAPQGGLHENIRATLKLLLTQGHHCTLLCREGSFADEVRALGAIVVTTDFTDEGNAEAFRVLNELHRKQQFELVHTHPFHSRKIAQGLAKKWKLPLVTTIHGRYTDELETNHGDFDAIFAVSEGIRDYLIEQVGAAIRDRVFVAPNAVQLSMFTEPNWPSSIQNDGSKGPVKIALVSRFDKDKQFILNTVVASVRTLVERGATFRLVLVGSGTEQQLFVEQLTQLLRSKVEVRGWLSDAALVEAYVEADIVIAPGRCALEAMACGKPTIAIGSKGYVGLIDENNWQQGVYSNFGGIGNQEDDYPQNALANDIESLMHAPERRLQLGKLGRQLIELFYDEDAINRRVIGLYTMLVAR